LAEHPDIVAILVEPVQGEGGVNIPDSDYLPGLRARCDRHDILLMLDEVQTGVGRTGKFMAYQHHALVPDVVTLAKALGNGVPIGACLAQGKAAQTLTAGSHGSTFGGNPLACRAALAVLDTLTEQALIDQAAIMGQMLATALQTQLQHHSSVKDIRHLGLMLGIELNHTCSELVAQGLTQSLLINVTQDSIIRLLPPLVINAEHCHQIATTVANLIKAS
ncbi:MAG: aminotransferase class III-fold pyridoxal phosphate-dependent enzyme, partial [Methylococcales bacterium]|nr:aminotransferase class III-fold pyridoxal phosphate-dependent enzyme [Methylococcales bacterium]